MQPCREHESPCGHAVADASPLRASLPDEHVVAVLMDEHQRILAQLERLGELVADGAEPSGPEGRERLERIRAVAETLIGAEPHHQREERVLFPALVERGIDGPPRVMELEHVELRALKHAVHEHAGRLLDRDGGDWQRLLHGARGLIDQLRLHIAKEDQVLYPLALRQIPAAEWDGMRRRCDEIGYCCHAPARAS